MEDERLLELERQKQANLAENNRQLDNLLNERQELTEQQNNAVNQWEQTQNNNLDKQLNLQKDLINQQKQEAKKNYENEAKSAYADYRKENNEYGVSREQQAQAGLTNSGYSESSRVSMYNTYQNRLSNARRSMDKAYLDFGNAIKEAQLNNDVAKAENALTSLKNKLDISLEEFKYKDAMTRDKINSQNQIDNTYYNRYSNTINQINYEKEQAENRRRYEEELERKRQQDIQNQSNWEREYALRNKPVYSGGGSSSNRTSINTILGNNSEYEVNTPYYKGKFNEDVKNGTFKNKYQPNNVNGEKLKKTGDTITFNTSTLDGQSQTVTQNIWSAGGKKYYWDGRKNAYVEINTPNKGNGSSRNF